MALNDGDEAVLDSPFPYTYANLRKNHWYGATAPTNPQNGIIWVKNDGTSYFYHNAAWHPLLINSKVISSTRDLAAASGDVVYAGVGFMPTAIIVIGAQIAGTHAIMNVGFSDSALDESVIRTQGHSLTAAAEDANKIFSVFKDGTNYQYAVVKSYDADGVTLTWTKVLNPTGTFEFGILCLR